MSVATPTRPANVFETATPVLRVESVAVAIGYYVHALGFQLN